ncbi:DUF2793 domain-containing protein [Sphingomonas sp.]|uniref:DUF2793 domain-containing protein n=1 Tax=Sphingomonas sp. TaxID=28214 RepID=UPI002DD6594E|nr:DUF2793 domain-containing protein [Sphingomonas sp.]
MSETTARLGLPLIFPGQAQKEMTHNEALARLDAMVQARVIAIGQETPPPEPAPGDCWVIGETPDGAWSGQAGALATWTPGGWRFVTPWPGFRVWVDDDQAEASFADGGWHIGRLAGTRLVLDDVEMLGAPAGPIADPAGGVTVDDEARAAIAAVLVALRHHNLVETP